MGKEFEPRINPSPHIHDKTSTAKIMWTVSCCLLPAGAWGVWVFGLDALFVILVSIASAVLAEIAISGLRGKITVRDGSAFLTGLLVAYNMPPAVPGYIPAIASIFAIIVVKQVFGGLGRNFMNPALAGRAFALLCWKKEMTTLSVPILFRFGAQGASTAAAGSLPLAGQVAALFAKGSIASLLVGNVPGCIGEVSKILLLIGALVLLFSKIITLEIPIAYIATFSILVWIFPETRGGVYFQGDVLPHLLSGSLILGAFFMATDIVTSPLTRIGMLIFGIGCGLFTFLIQTTQSLSDGVCFSIIIMNIAVPLINKLTKPVKFGYVKRKSGA